MPPPDLVLGFGSGLVPGPVDFGLGCGDTATGTLGVGTTPVGRDAADGCSVAVGTSAAALEESIGGGAVVAVAVAGGVAVAVAA